MDYNITQGGTKFQAPGYRREHWCLEPGASLELGVWSLELFARRNGGTISTDPDSLPRRRSASKIFRPFEATA